MATGWTTDEHRATTQGKATECPNGRIGILGGARSSLQRLAGLLSASGYDVRFMSRWGAAADFDWAASDLLLVDVVEGLSFLREVLAAPNANRAPIIVLGAAHRLREMREALELGSADYLVEPVRADDVLLRLALHQRPAGVTAHGPAAASGGAPLEGRGEPARAGRSGRSLA